MSATAWAVYAVQAAVVLALGGLAARALRARSAAFRHLAWTSALALVVLLPLLAAAMPEWPVRLPLPEVWADVGIATPAGGEAAASGNLGGAVGRRSATAPERATRPGPLALLWLAGSLALGARIAAGRLALAALRRSAVPVEDRWALAWLGEAARAAGCRRPPRLLVSARIAAPVAFGVLSPVVVLPRRWREWPGSRLRSALLHETWHVRRRDAATQLLAEAVRAVHWFDPLAWMAARSLERERERACDDAVLASGTRPVAYAEDVLAVARETSGALAPAAALSLASRRGAAPELERRLRAILDRRVSRRPPTRAQAARLAAALAAGAAAAAGLALAPAFAIPSWSELDDPLSERLSAEARPAELPEPALADAPDRQAILRLQTLAYKEKTWEGDLVAERARWTLARVEDGEVVGPLIAELADPDWRVRAYAAWGLAVAGDPRAAEPLRPLLDHPVWRVRAQAVASLFQLGAELPLPVLARLAGDPAWQVRIGAVDHLARRGDAGARRLLEGLAADRHGGVRQQAAASLKAAASTSASR